MESRPRAAAGLGLAAACLLAALSPGQNAALAASADPTEPRFVDRDSEVRIADHYLLTLGADLALDLDPLREALRARDVDETAAEVARLEPI